MISVYLLLDFKLVLNRIQARILQVYKLVFNQDYKLLFIVLIIFQSTLYILNESFG